MHLNKTKLTSLALAFTLSVSLAACSGDDSSTASDTSSTPDSSSASTSTDGGDEGAVASFGPASDFDYENFSPDQNITAEGFFEDVVASDFVTLPDDFDHVTVPTAEVTPTDESIQAQIDELMNSYATTEEVTDRPAENGDTVSIDYSGSVGGVAFDGGTASDAPLTLGSGKFIAGFEEAIVGHSIGDSFDIQVTFPEGYADSKDADGNVIVLSGAEATFAITLNSIETTVVPELTDEWVQENLYEIAQFATVAQLTEAITSELFTQNINLYVWQYITLNTKVSQVPAVIMNYHVCQFLDYYNTLSASYGVDFDTFLTSMVGLQDTDALLAMQEALITDYAKLSLIQQAVAEQLNIQVTDDVLKGYAEYANSYPANYIAMNAMIDLVEETVAAGVEMA